MDGITKPRQLFDLHTSTLVPLPKTPNAALSSPEWYNAMYDEFSALIKNKTWELVPRHPDMNIIRSMWLFKYKFKSDGSLEWYKALLVCDGRKQQGFSQSKSDNSLFIYHKNNQVAYLLIYVDDIILTTSSDALRQQLIRLLAGEFATKDLGPLSYFLGIAVTRTGNNMILSQHSYATDIIHRAGMESCKPVATPVDTQSKLGSNSGPLFEDPTLYRSLAGALQYLNSTRPDITYSVQQVCMHMHSPSVEHWNALKRIIRYLQGTSNFGLHLGPASSVSLVAYTDADWAGCPDTRRSTSGYCVYLGDNLISWSSKRQSTISRSSAEAEYHGVANVVAEIC
ncbi:uncharacterized mitochondrial protein AtMg00810-like [Helianthus annuus]|uniref:uncharacterized mitochondrial protein AtMg00810-like n=1 Tax=Helianthus annuus TaxID=4232 RepID=UPI000B8FCCFD|nr:uncharacterized mitochondrial protein AtMg00810-like [Helianthus annuus]